MSLESLKASMNLAKVRSAWNKGGLDKVVQLIEQNEGVRQLVEHEVLEEETGFSDKSCQGKDRNGRMTTLHICDGGSQVLGADNEQHSIDTDYALGMVAAAMARCV